MSEPTENVTTERRADKPKFLTQTTFKSFTLPDEVMKGLDVAGFTHCTPIQANVLPVSLIGKDIAGQAQTGTGKTAAFLVTIFTRLLSLPRPKNGLPSALVVAPTRELAHQIYEEAEVVGRHTGFRMVEVVGGVDYVKQADALKSGTDLVICTPGRVIDYMKQKIFKTAGIQIVVIDEADRLLDLGFEKDMRYILKNLPSYQKRQSMLFSATLSYRVLELTYEYMNLPEFIAVAPEEITVEGIDQTLYHVGKDRKMPLLLGILAREKPHRCLIFVNTKVGVEWVTQKLKGNKWPAEGITGDLPQRKRFKRSEGFKNGRIKIWVATDGASRGIHVEDVSHVVNYDLPQDSESYVHRIGRTARAGKTGYAVSLACEDYVYHLEPLEQMLNYKIPVIWAEEELFAEDLAGIVRIARKPRGKKPPRGKTSNGEKKPPRLRVPTAFGQRPPGYFPGTFFGFFPPHTVLADVGKKPGKEEKKPGKEEKKPGEAEKKPADAGKNGAQPESDMQPAPRKKRRRTRRKKKRSPKSPQTQASPGNGEAGE